MSNTINMKTIPPPYFPPPVSSGNFLSCTVQLPLSQQHKIKHGTQCSYFARSQNLAGVRMWSLSSESWTVYHPCFSMWCIHFQLYNFVTFWGLPHPHRSSPSTVSDPFLSIISTDFCLFFFFSIVVLLCEVHSLSWIRPSLSFWKGMCLGIFWDP